MLRKSYLGDSGLGAATALALVLCQGLTLQACSKPAAVASALAAPDTSVVNVEAVLATDMGPQPEPAPPGPPPYVVPAECGAVHAGQVAESFVKTADIASDPEIAAIMQQIILDPPTKAQAAILRAKGQAGTEAMTRALWSDNPNLRLKMAALFAELEPPVTPAISAAFIHALLDEPLPAARSATARALVDYKVEAALPALMQMVEMDREPNARSHAAYALGAMRSQSAVPALIRASRDPESWVRLRAVTALGRCGGKAAKDAVKAALKDPNDLVRDTAKRASGKFR